MKRDATKFTLPDGEGGFYGPLEAIKSGAGSYIGRWHWEPEEPGSEEGFIQPGSRESDYFAEHVAAERHLAAMTFEVRQCGENEAAYNDGILPRPKTSPRRYHVTFTMAAHPEGVTKRDLADAHLKVWGPNKEMCAADRVLILSVLRMPGVTSPRPGVEPVDCRIYGVDGETAGPIAPADAFGAFIYALSGLVSQGVHPAQAAFAARIEREYDELISKILGAPGAKVH